MTTASRTTHFDRWPVGRRVGKSRRGKEEQQTGIETQKGTTHKTRQKIMERREQGLPLWPSGDKKSRRVVFFPLLSRFWGFEKERTAFGLIDTNLPWGFFSLFLFISLPHPLVSFYSSLFLIRIASKRVLIQQRDRAHPDSEFRLGFSDTETLACVHLYSPTFERILNYWGRSIATA